VANLNYVRVVRRELLQRVSAGRTVANIVDIVRMDWPLGPALRRRRLAAGLSVKAAARRTGGKVSDGRWYQLESGVQRVAGQDLPIHTTAATVAAAAKAVDWDVEEALQVAGFNPDDYMPPQEGGELRRFSTRSLLNELQRRLGDAEDNPPL
jgi:hypothetical protein